MHYDGIVLLIFLSFPFLLGYGYWKFRKTKPYKTLKRFVLRTVHKPSAMKLAYGLAFLEVIHLIEKISFALK